METRGRAPLRLGSLLRWAVWFGLVAGLLEAGIVLIQRDIVGQVVLRSPHLTWMAPVGNVLLFVGLAILLRALAAAWPGVADRRSVALVFVFAAVLAVLSAPRWLHPAAVVVLAGGVALRVGGPFARSVRTDRRMRRSTPALIGIVLLLVAAAFGLPRYGERRGIAALPRSDGDRPNVLLIILDTVRAASLGLYGYEKPTSPELERIATKAVVFDLAIAPSSWTLPSHASMFTGQGAHDLEVGWDRPLAGDVTTLAEHLAGLGYATAGFSANHYFVEYEHGLQQGFHRWEDYRTTFGSVLINTSLWRYLLLDREGWANNTMLKVLGVEHRFGFKSADVVNGDVLDWLSHERSQPFFVFVNYIDAHLPYVPPPPFARRFGSFDDFGILGRIRRELNGDNERGSSAANETALQAAYEESIAYVDSELGSLLDSLERSGRLDNTLVVITSDHGEEFGEHDTYDHGSNLCLHQVHVPLVIVPPGGLPAQRRVTHAVSLSDLPTTILELAGLGRGLPGTPLLARTSFQPAASSEISPAVSTLVMDRTMASVVTDTHHYYRTRAGREWAHALSTDLKEEYNLAESADSARILPELRQLLVRSLGTTAAHYAPDGRKTAAQATAQERR